MSAYPPLSRLQTERQKHSVLLPKCLRGSTTLRTGSVLSPPSDGDALRTLFPQTFGAPTLHIEASAAPSVAPRPLRVGAVLSGGQAPGGHNVLSGIYDGIKRFHPDSVFYGFLEGPRGLFKGEYVEVSPAMMDRYRNMGGFDAIGSGRDKIETPEQFAGARAVAEKLQLDGVVVIGGDDSNTNAAVLAEYFKANGCTTKVVGAPKTIDGDLKIPGYVDVSFGFDTACRTYAELIGNVCVDVVSSRKYWHFCRLMGRAASNITLEAALQTHPNLTLIGEEVGARAQNLAAVTGEIVDCIQARAAGGKNYGVILIPEGIIEFIPEVNALLAELNELLAHGVEGTPAAITSSLSPPASALFTYLPPSIQKQLLADRDPHGNVQISLVETEKLFAELVAKELDARAAAGACPLPLAKPGKWPIAFQFHFFGYEGRCALPCDFDSSYCYALGTCAATLLSQGCTGVMSCVNNLYAPVEEWTAAGVPLTAFFNLERRHGKDKPVIKKALVELNSLPFKTFAAVRSSWVCADAYRNPGPIQLYGSGERVALCYTLALEYAERLGVDPGSDKRFPLAPPSEGFPAAGAAGAEGGGSLEAAYEALVRGVVGGLVGGGGSGGSCSLGDYLKLYFWRLDHKLKDPQHEAVLAKVGISPAAWRALENTFKTQ